MNNFEFGEVMKRRTKAFALQIVELYKGLPRTDAARVLGRQVLRSGTSVAANYRAACRAKSAADFISKLGTTVEEADQTVLWLELLEAAEVASSNLDEIKREADELLRILVASLTTARNRNRR